MDLETITSEVSQTEKDKYHITYMWNLKQQQQQKKKQYEWTYLQNRNKVTDVENKCMITRGKEKERRDKLGNGDWHIHNTIYKIDN